MFTVILSLALASSAGCTWDHPGANPYRHSGHPVSAALKDYHLPPATTQALQRKMDARAYDDIVEIKRDSIVGKNGSYDNLRGMHSGRGHYCSGPTQMAGWQDSHVERGLVYCEGETCVVVPTVCNNVALLSRKPEEIDIAPAAGPGNGNVMGGAPPVTNLPVADTTPPDLSALVVAAPPDEFSPPGGGSGGSGGPIGWDEPPFVGGGGGGGGSIITPPPVVAVSEPGIAFLLLVGLMLVFRQLFRRK
jgi:hypothetical protein